MGNLTAGIGDPYWYEWSVGLLNIIKMLNSDNNIKNVVLQSDENQCLDDVVVTFKDGSVQYIQVKHTRQNDTLTFSDLIQGEKEKSYLNRFSDEWLAKQKQGNADNLVVLFTNRRIGDRKYTPKNQWERPPLDLFWVEIKKQAKDLDNKNDINDISVKKDWEEAWNRFKAYMPMVKWGHRRRACKHLCAW